MIRLLLTASTEVRCFLRRYIPSNTVLDLVRARSGLKWWRAGGVASGPYLSVTAGYTVLIENSGPRWSHLEVLVCTWSALMMVVIGPVNIVLLGKTRTREHQARKQTEREARQLCRSSATTRNVMSQDMGDSSVSGLR